MVSKTPLFQEIAESIRLEILYGSLAPGEELPTVREMAQSWGCAPGTVGRAYKELARQGLVSSRPGQGTRVTPNQAIEAPSPLRKASLVNQAEAFLLRAIKAGHTPPEIEQALGLALDRWRITERDTEKAPSQTLRFVGSHDPVVTLLGKSFAQQMPGFSMQLSFAGSLGGLIALARQETDIAGCHLWDEKTESYNAPFAQRLLPGQTAVLVTLAERRLGLMTASGNPHNVVGLPDLKRPELHFINRQPGAGTRVWLDAQLGRLEIAASKVNGYINEAQTHSEAASGIAAGQADIGLGIEAAALTYGLGFIPLTTERYDLVIPAALWETKPIKTIYQILTSQAMKTTIEQMGGYDTAQTGNLHWI